MTITEFLLARIAEERWKAGWDARPADVHSFLIEPDGTVTVNGERGADFEAYIDRYADPRRLAECEAKRRIVEEHDGLLCSWTHDAMEMHDPDDPCTTLRALASVYADHPGLPRGVAGVTRGMSGCYRTVG